MTGSLPFSFDSDRRQDFLVSIVFADASDGRRYHDVLKPLAVDLDRAFQFWEVVIALPEAGLRETSALSADLRGIPNLRILQLSAAGNFYRRRLAGVTEAIGDVVILTTLDEIGAVDISDLARTIYLSNEILVCVAERHNHGAIIPRMGRAFGFLTGYRIDDHDSLTVGLARSKLENLLLRPDAEILLRFEPLTGILSFKRISFAKNLPVPRRQWRDWRRRASLVSDMMIAGSPRILRVLAIVAFVSACLGTIYGIYAALVWLLKEDVAEGWLTTSLLLSLTTVLLGISIAAISTGLVRIFDFLSHEGRYAIVDEINTVDLIGNIKPANVDLVAETAISRKAAEDSR